MDINIFRGLFSGLHKYMCTISNDESNFTNG